MFEMIEKFTGAAALSALMATPLAALDLNEMTESEREAFRGEVRAYLMDHPEVLLEAINVLEERQVAEQSAGDIDLIRTNADDLFNDGYSHVGGNPDGDITIVEFLDYRCGYCKKAHPEVKELITTDGNIRIITKEYPILGDQSVLASRFAIAVKAVQGDAAYAVTNDTLMTMRGAVTEESLSTLSEESGYDTPAVFAAMNSDETKAIIDQNRALAQRLQINGTPSFVFETEMLRGYVPLDGMKQVVAQLRAN